MEKSLMVILSTKRLRETRKSRKKYQWEIADILSVKRPTYVGYEKNKDEIEVPASAAKAIAEFLKVDVTDLQGYGKVEKDEPMSGKYKIEIGDNIVMHKVALDELHQTIAASRKHLTDVIKNNTDLTQNNTKLTDSITDLVKNLLRSSGNQKG